MDAVEKFISWSHEVFFLPPSHTFPTGWNEAIVHTCFFRPGPPVPSTPEPTMLVLPPVAFALLQHAVPRTTGPVPSSNTCVRLRFSQRRFVPLLPSGTVRGLFVDRCLCGPWRRQLSPLRTRRESVCEKADGPSRWITASRTCSARHIAAGTSCWWEKTCSLPWETA